MKRVGMLTATGIWAVSGLTDAAAQPINVDQARRFIGERQAVCEQDAGKLWGKSLCGPILLVDAESRFAVADRMGASDTLQPNGTIFSGYLPATQPVANTAVDWDGLRWTMVLWPLPEDRSRRVQLLMHESWHAIQNDLGLPARSPVPEHLASMEGRVAMRLEWRALAKAVLASSKAERRAAIHDALVFRNRRRNLAENADELENQLELSEGLAEYTGVRLSGQGAPAITASLSSAEQGKSFARSFAYTSGPAYGFLLDMYQPDWRKHVQLTSDLGVMLAKASGVDLADGHSIAAARAGDRYDESELRRFEQALAAERDKTAAMWRQKLVDGAVLHLPFRALQGVVFSPRDAFPLGAAGTVYPTLRVIDEWGVLEVKNSGALLDGSWKGVSVPAPAVAGGLTGDGWTLTLNPGWSVTQSTRSGDFTLRKSE